MVCVCVCTCMIAWGIDFLCAMLVGHDRQILGYQSCLFEKHDNFSWGNQYIPFIIVLVGKILALDLLNCEISKFIKSPNEGTQIYPTRWYRSSREFPSFQGANDRCWVGRNCSKIVAVALGNTFSSRITYETWKMAVIFHVFPYPLYYYQFAALKSALPNNPGSITARHHIPHPEPTITKPELHLQVSFLNFHLLLHPILLSHPTQKLHPSITQKNAPNNLPPNRHHRICTNHIWVGTKMDAWPASSNQSTIIHPSTRLNQTSRR